MSPVNPYRVLFRRRCRWDRVQLIPCRQGLTRPWVTVLSVLVLDRGRSDLVRFGTAQAAQATADIFVEEAEGGGHEASQVGEGEKGEGDAEYGVEDGDDSAPIRPRGDVTVT